jgi:hypothetical protein
MANGTEAFVSRHSSVVESLSEKLARVVARDIDTKMLQ